MEYELGPIERRARAYECSGVEVVVLFTDGAPETGRDGRHDHREMTEGAVRPAVRCILRYTLQYPATSLRERSATNPSSPHEAERAGRCLLVPSGTAALRLGDTSERGKALRTWSSCIDTSSRLRFGGCCLCVASGVTRAPHRVRRNCSSEAADHRGGMPSIMTCDVRVPWHRGHWESSGLLLWA